MADPVRRGAAGPAAPGRGDVRLAGSGAARRREVLRAWRRRCLAFDEAVIEATHSRAADEVLAAAGLAPAPVPRHLQAVR